MVRGLVDSKESVSRWDAGCSQRCARIKLLFYIRNARPTRVTGMTLPKYAVPIRGAPSHIHSWARTDQHNPDKALIRHLRHT